MQVDSGVMRVRSFESVWKNAELRLSSLVSRYYVDCVWVSVIGWFNWGFAWLIVGLCLCGVMLVPDGTKGGY